MVDDGVIQTNSGKLGNVTVKGAIEDGSGLATTSGDIGAVKIGANFQTTSQIKSGGALGALTIGGSALGAGSANADIQAATGITSISIHGEFGAQVATTGGNIGPITVGGDAVGASVTSAGTLGAVKIAGLFGDSSIKTQGSIASVTVGKSVVNSQILAGATAVSPNAVNIGAVKGGGDWVASNMSAGVEGTMGSYGDTTDTQLAASSKITSISIAGTIIGGATSMSHFGFDAESIGSFTYDGTKLKLPTTFPANIPLDPILNDVAIELI
jgi:hypothetical protein